jgi:hypothetical protein
MFFELKKGKRRFYSFNFSVHLKRLADSSLGGGKGNRGGGSKTGPHNPPTRQLESWDRGFLSLLKIVFLGTCGILFRMNTVTNRPVAKKKVLAATFKRYQARVGVQAGPLRVVPKLSAAEEAFLSGITASGQFTIQKSVGMYSDVRPLRSAK